MTSVMRRINAPTRYGGLPARVWLVLALAFLLVVLLVTVLHTPLAPTLVALTWLVVTPSLLLAMWAHQQGVSVAILVGDTARFAARRHRGRIVHERAQMLRGGVVLSGPLPDPGATKPLSLDLDLEAL